MDHVALALMSLCLNLEACFNFDVDITMGP